jgi:purine nucleoside permease
MRHRTIAAWLLTALALFSSPAVSLAASEPIEVKVFIAAMFEIGQNSGDRAGEFQQWYEHYWKDAKPIEVKGALKPVYCNENGVCGSVLGMGKVNSSASMQAILLDPAFDFSKAYYILSGVAGTPPSRRTSGDGELGHVARRLRSGPSLGAGGRQAR